MKKILILGAGVYQVPLIKTAKRLGLYTIVASIPGNYPGFKEADKVVYENTVDSEAILKVAREENVSGIVTAGTDVAVITIGRVCDALGLKGLSGTAAEIASNKLKMKSRYEEFGVRTARFRKVALSDENYQEKFSDLEFPLIFKSVDSSGSRGIMRVDSPADFEKARKNSAENTHSDHFIVEEFIEGNEFGAQAFVQDGKVEFILPHGDYVFKGDTGVPIGHYAPFEILSSQESMSGMGTDSDPEGRTRGHLSEESLADIREQLEKAIAAMSLDNCAINADFIMKDNKTYVLELGGRSGATCLAELVSIYYGYDYYEKILRVALGEKVSFEPAEFRDGKPVLTPNASMLLSSDRDGVIVSQEDRNPKNPNIVEVQFDCVPGDEVHAFRVGPHRIGHVITKGETLKDATAELHRALENITINVE